MALDPTQVQGMADLSDLFRTRASIDDQIADLKARRQEVNRVIRQSTTLMRTVADAIDADPNA
jgi:hypothetical protein